MARPSRYLFTQNQLLSILSVIDELRSVFDAAYKTRKTVDMKQERLYLKRNKLGDEYINPEMFYTFTRGSVQMEIRPAGRVHTDIFSDVSNRGITVDYTLFCTGCRPPDIDSYIAIHNPDGRKSAFYYSKFQDCYGSFDNLDSAIAFFDKCVDWYITSKSKEALF